MSDPPPVPDESGRMSQPPRLPGPPALSSPKLTRRTNLGIGQDAKLAGAGNRLAARVLDWVILTAVVTGFGVVLAVVMQPFEAFVDIVGLGGAEFEIVDRRFVPVFATVSLLVVVLYDIIMVAVRGQTLGKMMARIRVVNAANGTLPGWSRSCLRVAVPFVPIVVGAFVWYVGLLSLLVYASLLWDKRRQGWHDKSSGTVVIKV